MRLLASTCFPSRRRFAANPGGLPIFPTRIKKNLDQRRLDMSLGLVLLRSGGLVLVGFSSTAAAGRSMRRSSTGDSVLESGAQVASVWLASRVGLGKQEGKGWKLPSICNLLLLRLNSCLFKRRFPLLPPHSVNTSPDIDLLPHSTR